MLPSLFGTALLSVLAALPPAAAAQSAPSPPLPCTPAGVPAELVTACVHGRPVWITDLDAHWSRSDPASWLDAQTSLHRSRVVAQREVIAAALAAAAAEAAGVPLAEHAEAQIAERYEAPDEALLLRARRTFTSSLPPDADLPAEMIDSYVRSRLEAESRAIALAGWNTDLRAAAGDAVAERLVPPRVEVPLSGSEPEILAGGDAAAPDPGAAVDLVVFSDFTCPYCRSLAGEYGALKARYGSSLRIVHRFFPLPREGARESAEAAWCAFASGAFEPFHDGLFAASGPVAAGDYAALSGLAGAEADGFAACVSGGQGYGPVEDDVAAGVSLGVISTPTSFVNGRPFVGSAAAGSFFGIIDEELARLGLPVPAYE